MGKNLFCAGYYIDASLGAMTLSFYLQRLGLVIFVTFLPLSKVFLIKKKILISIITRPFSLDSHVTKDPLDLVLPSFPPEDDETFRVNEGPALLAQKGPFVWRDGKDKDTKIVFNPT